MTADLRQIVENLGPNGRAYLRLAEGVDLRRPAILQIIARYGKGDGVAQEVAKQMAPQMWGDSYEFRLLTGEMESSPTALGLKPAEPTLPAHAGALEFSGRDPLRRAVVVPELAFSDPVNVDIERRSRPSRDAPRSPELAEGLVADIEAQAEVLRAKLGLILRREQANGAAIIVVQNLNAIPMHLPAGLALAQLFSRDVEAGGVVAQGRLIHHLHDFTMDRLPERYLPVESFERIYGAADGGPLSQEDRHLCGALLEHIAFAFGLDLSDHDAILAALRQDMEQRCRVNLSLADDDAARAFPSFVRALLQRRSELQPAGALDDVPVARTELVRDHVRWVLSHGRMSIDPYLTALLMNRVLDVAFPCRHYRADVDQQAWTINARSGEIYSEVTGLTSIYFPNIFDFPPSWSALLARHRSTEVQGLTGRIGVLMRGLHLAPEDRLLTNLVRIVPRKQLELSIDLLVQLLSADSAARYKLAIVGRSGDEGEAYRRRLIDEHVPERQIWLDQARRAQGLAPVPLDAHLLWITQEGNDADRIVEDRQAFTPFEWAAYFRARGAIELYPSKIEGWGNRLGELAAAGVPCLPFPYPVLVDTILPELEAAGYADVYHLLRRSDDPSCLVPPETVRFVQGLFEDRSAYDAVARGAFEAMRDCYGYAAVREKLQGSIPAPTDEELELLRPILTR